MKKRLLSAFLAFTLIFSMLIGTSITASADSSGSAVITDLDGPTHILFDANGNMYISDYVRGAVYKVTKDKIAVGDYTMTSENTWNLTSDEDIGNNQDYKTATVAQTQGLAADSDGNIYVASECTGVICKLRSDNDNNVTTFYKMKDFTQTDYAGIYGLVVIGNYLYASNRATGYIYKIDLTTKECTVFTHIPATDGVSLSGTWNMVASGNDLYVTVQSSGTVYKIDAQGECTAYATLSGLQPTGLAIDGSGNLFVGNRATGSESIYEVMTNGTKIKVGNPLVEGNIIDPEGIALSPDGNNMYVADWSAKRVVRFQTGAIIANYIDSSTHSSITASDTYTGFQGTPFTPKTINGYTLNSNSTNTSGVSFSNAAQTIDYYYTTNISIDTQPQSNPNASVGDAVTLSVSATANDGGTLSYQWYSNSVNSNSGGTAISSENTSSYTAPTTTTGTTYYYCVVTDTLSGTSTTLSTDTAEVYVVPTQTPELGTLTVSATAGNDSGKSIIRVSGIGNSSDALKYVVSDSTIASPTYGSTITGTTFSSGDTISGVSSGNYVDVYEVDSNGNVVGFGQIKLTSDEIGTAIPALGSLTISATAGNDSGKSIISVSGIGNSSNTLKYVVSDSTIASPTYGSTITGTTFSSGDTISGVSSGNYVGVYEVDSNGNVVGFGQIKLTSDEIGTAIPALGTLTVSATAGNDSGKSIISVSGIGNSSDTLKYVVSDSTIASPTYGSTITGTTFSSGDTISGVSSGNYVGVYEVNSNGNVVGFGQIKLTSDEIGTYHSGSGSGSGSNSTTTPVDVTINGSDNSSSTTSAKIPASDTNTSTVRNVIVNLTDVTVTAPSSVLNSALGSDTTSWLTLSQDTPTAATQTAVDTVAAAANVTPVGILDVDLTRYYSSGTSEAVHQLSSSVTVIIKLTDAQIAEITDISNAHLYYYDPDTGKLTDMSAAFNLTAKTATFTTSHFSTFVIAHSNSTTITKIGVTYDAHVQNIAWQPYVSDGAEAGTTGKSLRLEAVNIKLTGSVPTGAAITYETYVQGTGWQSAASNGAESGTTHMRLRVEALRITLAGLSGYQVKYRVHVQNLGWQDWQTTNNGTDITSAALAGTQGKSSRVEAVEIIIEKAAS